MQRWLEDIDFDFNAHLKKPELYDVIKAKNLFHNIEKTRQLELLVMSY